MVGKSLVPFPPAKITPFISEFLIFIYFIFYYNVNKNNLKYLLSIKNVKEHNYFTERRLRPIAIITDSSEQIKKFGELVDNMRLELNGKECEGLTKCS